MYESKNICKTFARWKQIRDTKKNVCLNKLSLVSLKYLRRGTGIRFLIRFPCPSEQRLTAYSIHFLNAEEMINNGLHAKRGIQPFSTSWLVVTHLQSVTHDYSTFTASSEANSYFKFKGEKVVDIGECGTRKASTPNNE